MDNQNLRHQWQTAFGWLPPAKAKHAQLQKHLHYHQQAQQHGGLKKATLRQLEDIATRLTKNATYIPTPSTTRYQPGTRLIRTYQGTPHEVTITATGFTYNGTTYTSLSAIARHITGTAWNGHTFFGLKGKTDHG